MQVITVRNVHEALPEGIRQLLLHGVQRDSRNGPVLVFPHPVTTHYLLPRERVLFWADRDANPFLHFHESLWMLAGRNDVAYPARFAKNMLNYSDDGVTMHGAYGHRWRAHFNFDQLPHIINALRANPDDRRCVLQMWDAEADLGRHGRDFPCNTQVYFTRDTQGRLDMTVLCRSNDMIWGAYGANAVHFSYLQEYIAACIGCQVGGYWQVSNNLHAYLKTLDPIRHLADQSRDGISMKLNPYQQGDIEPYNMMSVEKTQWDMECSMFVGEGLVIGFQDKFFRRVANPLTQAWLAYKDTKNRERFANALDILDQCIATDWRLACREWMLRREASWKAKHGDSVNRDSDC